MKILLIRFSSIGDIVLTSPIIRCMKQQIHGLELHVLTKESFKGLFEENPHVDKIYVIKNEIDEVIHDLQNEAYDQIIDLHKNFRSIGVRSKLHVKSTSFPKLNLRKWLLVKFKINRLPSMHIVDRYFKSVEKLGVKNDGKGLDFFINAKDEVVQEMLPQPLRKGYIAIVIGGKHATKILPAEKVIELIHYLKHPVILLGGPEDKDRGDEILKGCGDNVFNACGLYSLAQSASIIRQALSVISNDTGLMHIAAAFKKRIISVWGNTVPEFGMYPYLPGDKESALMSEVMGLKCRPCSKIGFDHCPKGHFKCMMEQDAKRIAELAEMSE